MNRLLFRRILMFTTGVLGAVGGIAGFLPVGVVAGLTFISGVLKHVPKLLDENKPEEPK